MHYILSDMQNATNYEIQAAQRGTVSSKPFQKDIDIDLLLVLYSSPWFRRLWVVQEAVLAPTSVCHWGQSEFPLSHVLNAAFWLLHKLQSTDAVHCQLGMLNANRMYRYADAESRKEKRALSHLLKDLQDFDAYDPRDHVYGLLGIHQHLHRSKTASQILQPDYSKTVAEVLSAGTKLAIQDDGSLHICGYICHHIPDPAMNNDVPSWVPSFHRRWDRSLDESPLESLFRADDQRSMVITEDPENVLDLGISGCEVDVVASCSHIMTTDSLKKKKKSESIPAAENFAAAAALKHDIPEAALSMVLIAGSAYGDRRLVNEREGLAGYHAARQLVRGKGECPSIKGNADAWYCLQAIGSACSRCRLFISAKGYLGVGPRTLDAGHQGCDVSFPSSQSMVQIRLQCVLDPCAGPHEQ